MARRVTNRPTQEFITSSVDIEPDTNCWLWNRYVQSLGYGQAEVCGKIWLAHRLSWTVYRGVIPAGLLVLHRCDTPLCVNPQHLFLGTHQDNTDDRVAKGRFKRGPHVNKETKPRLRKVTDDQVREIRSGRDSDAGYALRYGLGRTTVCDIRNRKTKTLVPD